MEKQEIKQNLGLIPEIKKALEEVKALFSSTEKPRDAAAPSAEPTPSPAPAQTEPVKIEFNHEEFTKNFNDYKTSNEEKFKSFEEKFIAFESQLKSANETIAKQEDTLKKTFALVEKVLEAPAQMSKQTKKEGVKVKSIFDMSFEEQLQEFQKKQ